MPTLLIIRGTSGSGKTTIAQEIAKKRKLPYFSYDTFLFGINIGRKYTKKFLRLIADDVLACMQIHMDAKQDMILEGALVATHVMDYFHIDEFVQTGKKNGYKVKVVQLTCNHETAIERMRKRGTVVNKITYKNISDALKRTKQKDEIIIDTTDLSVQQTIKKIESLL